MRRTLFRETIFLALMVVLLSALVTGCSNHHEQPAVQHRFDNIEYWAGMFEDPERDRWQKPAEVVEAMHLKPGDVVADIGAGTGYFTRRFAVAVGPEGKAIGLDIEPGMVQFMNDDAKKLGLSSYVAKVVKTDDPELAPMSVDVIFLCNTYHHIDNRVEYFKGLSKSLKPGGRVIDIDFYKNSDFGPPREHKIAKEVVIREMDRAGYRLITSHDILPEQYFLEFGL